MTDEDGDRIQAVIDAGCVLTLVSLLSHDETVIVVPALRSVGNIVTGSDVQVNILFFSPIFLFDRQQQLRADLIQFFFSLHLL